MKLIFLKIDHLNSWYDKQREPYRFIFFLVVMCAWVLPLNWGVFIHSRLAIFFGLAGLMLTVALALTRVGLFRRFRR